MFEDDHEIIYFFRGIVWEFKEIFFTLFFSIIFGNYWMGFFKMWKIFVFLAFLLYIIYWFSFGFTLLNKKVFFFFYFLHIFLNWLFFFFLHIFTTFFFFFNEIKMKQNCILFENERLIEQPVKLENLTRKFTVKAKNFIEQNKENPFFLYFSYVKVHTGISKFYIFFNFFFNFFYIFF